MPTTATKRKRASRGSGDETTRYAQGVVAGSIVAGPYVRAACARHLRDLVEGPKRGLRWDVKEAQLAFEFFADILCLNGGQFEGLPFVLHESQKFIVGNLFGWKGSDGYRRFRLAYIEQAKGNGKSPLVAGIGLKMLTADREPRAEVYAFATKKDQAQILFRDAVAMVDQSPFLDRDLTRSGGRGKEWNIADLHTASFFRTVSSDDAQSGPRPHCAIGDEIHEAKSGMMIEMMRAGRKWRRQPLVILITNSGTDRKSVCWEYHEYSRKVCSGAVADDEFFGYVCALDEQDDPFTDESCWPKANPLLDVAVTRKYLREQVREAEGMPSAGSIVRRLNFCQWVESASPWISPDVWRGLQDEDFDDDLLVGRKCYGGLDLSSTTDLTAFVLLFEPTERDPKWRMKTWFWIPQETFNRVSVKDNPHYPMWKAAGWLTTTPGAAINKIFVLSTLVACAAKYEIAAIGYDRWRIEDLTVLIDNEGVDLPLQAFGQGFKDMAPAVDEFERMIVEGEIAHDGNPVMNSCVSSAVVDTDPAGNRKLTKERSSGKIDGAVAGVMAAGMFIAARKDDLSGFLSNPIIA